MWWLIRTDFVLGRNIWANKCTFTHKHVSAVLAHVFALQVVNCKCSNDIAHKRRPLAVFDWIYALIPWLWKWLQSTFARILRAICSACVWFMWIMPAVSTWFLFVATSKVLIKSANSLEPMTHHTSGWAGAYIIIFLSWPDRWSYRSLRAETRILRDNWFGFFSRCDYNCRQSHSTPTRTGTCSRTQSRMSVIEIRSSHVLIPRRCRRALCVCVFVCTEGIQIAHFDIASGT